MAALTGIINSLLSRRLVIEEHDLEVKAGRRRVALSLSPLLGNLLGIDLGTFNLRIVLINARGEIVAAQEEHTRIQEGRDTVIARCVASVKQMLSEHHVDARQVLGAGIAFSGVINVEEGLVLSYPRTGQVHQWRNVPLRSIFEDALGIPCYLEDSVRAIATIEKHQGQGVSLNDFVYVDVGMGVGASIFIRGELYRGFGGGAGEFGHIAVDEGGPACCCGSNGCLEAIASGSAIIDAVRLRLERGVPSSIYDELKGNFSDLSLEVIAKASASGDSLALRELVAAAAHIGAATADLINLLNPQVIIFGGALFRAAPELMIESIDRIVRYRAMEKAVRDVRLVVSRLCGNAGALGVAHLMGERLLPKMFSTDLSASISSRDNEERNDAFTLQ